ncbi:diguanylate cyclase [Pseudonocardia bannensis]|uniref:GGDEF domain-containing protein n=1 Tax=Pseudonocardia bannensis TaxID=630973 RepID=A0A848DMB4_9PSEU|nr:GGDEF domain-containing protein [Pseudonocardia bannensis]NMH93636.1 GGDEF domain-containing protein [Pseudonocardia bannensis]
MYEPASRARFITRWAVWRLDSRVIASILLVESAVLALVVTSAALERVTREHLVLTAWLVAFGVLHTEVATGIERIRRQVAGTSYFDLSSVWTFAAAVLLPPALAAGVIVVLYVHLWIRVWRPARVPLYRHVFTTATVVLAAFVAHVVTSRAGGIQGWPGDLSSLGTIALAILLYVTVNTALVGGAIALTNPPARPGELLGHWDDNALEIATLCLGALAAIALTANPWLVVLVLPPLLVLHRAVLVRQLEEVANTDGKTGLLTAAAWHARATRAIGRAEKARESVAVLICDLDHFKAINDMHGHLAGDQVLAAVATALRAEVRGRDLVGRFGGEEFVVLVPDLPLENGGRAEVHAVGERIRHRISMLTVAVDTPDGALTVSGLGISVGGAVLPPEGATLEQVMKIADASLYAAKRDGRNTVRIAGLAQIPAARNPTA